MDQNAFILTLNSGSSSLKFALFQQSALQQPTAALQAYYRGQFSHIGTNSRWQVWDADNQPVVDERRSLHAHEALQTLLQWISQRLPDASLLACGHRIVHGGQRFHTPLMVNAEVIDYLQTLIPLAPNHQPAGLQGIETLRRLQPELPQIACFDTAFHQQRNELEQRFALPDTAPFAEIRRYGFHGLSYQYIASVLPQVLRQRANGKVVVAHLGHGASLCAMQQRRSIATSMTFTPLDGLPMGTRCGSIDPAVVLYLQQQGMSADAISDALYFQSGLLGLSGISDDVSILLQSDHPAAAFALDYFIHHCAQAIAAMAAAMDGIDDLVFTAGIGEHSAILRAKIARRCRWLGVQIDEQANLESRSHISPTDSPVQLWVIPTNEESIIAQQSYQLLTQQAESPAC